ncbi:dual-specificity tyrosine-(Y)-phosphorylation regulated kinase [Angomonas deanei]|uniref:Protein tyrosine kinase/Protein kinase domain containing protein, putative n=1 Tax=Angomonas deanei TaxID=59799 RepID=A0A7G2CDV7_9TRYP|nr:dual-specificity tyrosine-(Y)-phosphorylation regulated kinase [Angomonas deanei]CAD2216873.1 Protein tyrosine kinase/Protein kinase domain containing protein, putative [Angomonas deanei]|eukprot:EPY18386.1 dual-specificity tyrosine-(Y)-phosphorylation regulated kinase [Angomonas deanei]
MYPVAIKIIKNKGNYVRQAQQELSVLEQLNRNDPNDERNVIRVLDNFFFRNHFFIVFELLNADLYSICYHNKFRPFPSEVIFDVAAQVLEALKFTASEGIIHCDLKPENIVLNQREDSLVSCVSLKKNPSSAKDLSRCVLNNKFTGSQMNQYAYKRLKVIDFGSAFVEANAYKQKKFTYIQSRYYRAPEIILGIDNYNYDYSIDVWSFGCILCELKNGFPIFPAQCEGELLERITEYFGDFSSDIIRRSKRAGRFFNKIGDTDEYEMKPNLSKKKRKRHPPCSRTLEAFLGIKGTANPNDDDDGSDSDGPHNNPTKPIQYGSSNNNKEDTNISSLLLQQEFAFLDLIRRCLVIDPKKRITAAAALEHPWIKNWFTIRTATAGKVKIVYK